MKVNKFLSILVLMILFALSTLGAKESIKEIRISGELAKEEVDALSSIFDRYIGEDLSNDLIASAESEVSGAFGWVESLSILDSTKDEDGYSLEVGVEKYPESEKDIASVLYNITKEQVRSLILDDGIRPDNRKYTEIRPIWIDTGILPRAHGSGLFKRGQTQALSVATLGTISEEQRLDGLTEQTEKRYMHHYNFPPYSVGEAKPMRSPGRREIGHGALAERAILPVLPSVEEFPYAIRVVSEILSSNGSTSQASVCGSCLALMDAGVPIKAPVAGIAMGLVERVEEDGSSTMAILSDIQGMEDFLGDMDFKVAGTAKGVTAIQMDIKVHGLSKKVLQDALKQAKDGRMHIMQEMLAEIPEPRKELSPYAPRIITMQVDPDKIRIIIGPGGKTINAIVEKTGVKIDIDDEGQVFIASTDMEGAEAARKEIELLTKDVEVGEVYEGKVTRIMNFGAFIEILPGKEGLLHISKMAKGRVEKVEDVMNVGDIVKVKVTEIDSQDRINLSRKELL